ncbi:MAG: hypothetical protein AB8G22_09250 [Saprospiraceae bacterium]
MKKLLFFYLLLCTITACQKHEFVEPSDCIKERIDAFAGINVVQANIKGEHWYLFHDGSVHSDGVEFILNQQCDTVCLDCGECAPPDCIFEFYAAEKDTIWEQ